MAIHSYRNIILILFTAVLFFASCDFFSEPKTVDVPTPTVADLIVPDFNADSAYYFIEKQVSFGPRVPNTQAHQNCGDWIISRMKEWTDTVIVQAGTVIAFDKTPLKFRNIIASFNPQNGNRIILAAHWDTRPFSDHDKNSEQWRIPIDGANDGASGVGVLMEVARQLALNQSDLGIDIIFFDAEDYGQPQFHRNGTGENSYCLGSQYWSNNPHVENYKAKYGILLDMVGAKGSSFRLEGYSMQVAPALMRGIWNVAHRIGHAEYFIFQKTAPITDDHYYVHTITGIPMIDIISLHPENIYSFHHTWHTQQDNMEIIDKKVLKAVGETLMTALQSEAEGKLL